MSTTPGGQDRADPNPTGRGPGRVRQPDFDVAVNGRPPSDWFNERSHEHSKSFTITPGESLAISVRMTVAAPGQVTDLWLGLWHAVLSGSRSGPIGMDPVLHHTSATLPAGDHSFEFGWTVPADVEFAPNLWFGFHMNGLLRGRTGGSPERLIEATIAGPIAVLFRSPEFGSSRP